MVRYAKAPNALMVLEYNVRSVLQSKLSINELLEYSRLSASQVSVRMQNLMLRDELQAIVNALQTEQRAGGDEFALLFDEALPLDFYSDRDLLMQALNKLIQCVNTGSGQGPLLIHVQAQSADAIVVSVETDTSRELATISSARETRTLDSPAHTSGLAFPIAQSLAELLGATAGVESAPERGPRFWIRLPIKQNTIPAG